jgi:hypothetical protein
MKPGVLRPVHTIEWGCAEQGAGEKNLDPRRIKLQEDGESSR